VELKALTHEHACGMQLDGSKLPLTETKQFECVINCFFNDELLRRLETKVSLLNCVVLHLVSQSNWKSVIPNITASKSSSMIEISLSSLFDYSILLIRNSKYLRAHQSLAHSLKALWMPGRRNMLPL